MLRSESILGMVPRDNRFQGTNYNVKSNPGGTVSLLHRLDNFVARLKTNWAHAGFIILQLFHFTFPGRRQQGKKCLTLRGNNMFHNSLGCTTLTSHT